MNTKLIYALSAIALICAPSLFAVERNKSAEDRVLQALLIEKAREYAELSLKGTFKNDDVELLKGQQISDTLRKLGVGEGNIQRSTQAALKQKRVTAIFVKKLTVSARHVDGGKARMLNEIQMIVAAWEEEITNNLHYAIAWGDSAGGGGTDAGEIETPDYVPQYGCACIHKCRWSGSGRCITCEHLCAPSPPCKDSTTTVCKPDATGGGGAGGNPAQ